ncbi:MAG: VanZ family protein [Herminiimonas sp.]|nr:VanZ family protein [Herminiimonas sp.]
MRASVFARVALLVYVLLITYGSWYPFTGWRITGLSPLAFITAPLPHYWTGFDLVTNVIAYVPLGVLAVFALFPFVRSWGAVLLATLGGVLLSGSMEAVQTFLPSRVSSNLDLLTNSSGVCLGALFAPALTRYFLEDSRFVQVRQRWFTHEASRGFLVLALWPLAQIYPQSYLFGHGQLLPLLSEWLTSLLAMPVDLGALLRQSADLTVEQYWLSEAIITACGLNGVLLTLLCVLRSRAPRGVLLALLTGAALAIKSLTSALLFGPENAFGWLTPGAQGGLILGLVMLTGLIAARRVAQRRVAVLMLAICLLTLNLAPANPYFIATMQGWTQGKFLNFNGAAQFLSMLWPYLALWFLLHRTHRAGHAERMAPAGGA